MAAEAVEREQRLAIAREKIEQMFESSALPSRWRRRRLEDYRDRYNAHALKICLDWAESVPTHGLLLFGPVGVGKTHLSAGIAVSLMERSIAVRFGTVATLLQHVRSGFDRREESATWDELVTPRVLVIDDLGKEKVTEWSEQTMYELVNARYEAERPIIATSNLTLDQLRDRYPRVGEAMCDRLFEMCRPVRMEGPSWRSGGLGS